MTIILVGFCKVIYLMLKLAPIFVAFPQVLVLIKILFCKEAYNKIALNFISFMPKHAVSSYVQRVSQQLNHVTAKNLFLFNKNIGGFFWPRLTILIFLRNLGRKYSCKYS